MRDRTTVEVKGTPEYVRECCEASLKRLDVDYICYRHPVDTSVPIEDGVSMKSLFGSVLSFQFLFLKTENKNVFEKQTQI